jgi:hypothetical protein
VLLALLTILAMVLLGYIRQEYLILWEAPFQLIAIRRIGEEALSAGNFTAQLPALLVFLLLFWVGNSLLLQSMTRNTNWWRSLLQIYGVAGVLVGCLILGYWLLRMPVFLTAAQMVKEVLLSPLPALLLLPLIWWYSQSSNKLR